MQRSAYAVHKAPVTSSWGVLMWNCRMYGHRVT